MFQPRFAVLALTAILLSVTLAACESYKGEAKYPSGYDRTLTGGDIYGEKESVFGKGGLEIFGGKDKEKNDGSTGIGVNSYLWRASLDTVSFMPLASADPFGGVIITDWYTPAETPDERLKVNIVILGRQLRADGVRASVFRQLRDSSGTWADAAVASETATELEDAILTRARQLRIASAGS